MRVQSDDDSERMLAVCGPQVHALVLGERGKLQGTSCVHKGAPICKAVRWVEGCTKAEIVDDRRTRREIQG